MKTQFDLQISADQNLIVSIDKFHLEPNKINFLFGESGIGKSLISKTILSLIHPSHLDIKVNGDDYKSYFLDVETQELLKNSSFVFQEPSSHLNPRLTLKEQLNEGVVAGDFGENKILTDLWNSEESFYQLLDLYPSTNRPSGGEKQRFLNAISFKKYRRRIESKTDDDALFIFDEATGSLDETTRNLCINYLFKLYKEKPATLLIITHDYALLDYIYATHKTLVKQMVFKQLQRSEAGIKQTDFNTKSFFDWQSKLKPKTKKVKHTDSVVLKLKTDLNVFGKSLQIQQKNLSTDLIINKGELVYLKANSGVGKTTIAKVIMGIVQADQFEFELEGNVYNQKTNKLSWRKEIWGKKAAMQFQHADESLNLKSNILDSFRLLNSDLDETKLIEYLSNLFNHINHDLLRKPIRLLSGGQKQRVNILRSFFNQSNLLIMDEPLNGLDFLSITKVLKFMDKQLEIGKSILLISHNESIFDKLVQKNNIYTLVKL